MLWLVMTLTKGRATSEIKGLALKMITTIKSWIRLLSLLGWNEVSVREGLLFDWTHFSGAHGRCSAAVKNTLQHLISVGWSAFKGIPSWSMMVVESHLTDVDSH